MGFFGKKEDPDSLVAEAHELLRAGKAEEAAAKFRSATKLDPEHAEAWYCLGTIHSSAGRLEVAIDCYMRSAKFAPDDKRPLPIYNMGNALQALGNLDRALEAFTVVTKLDPEFADAWINRGRLLDDAGHHAEAIESYDKALALTPDDVTALANRGNSLRALHRFVEAKASYEAALVIEPDHPAALNGLGHCLAALGDPEKGLALIDRALEAVAFPPAVADRAILLSQLGRNEEALASLDEAMRLGVRNAQLYHNRGEVLGRLKRVQEAIDSFDAALKLEPHDAPALFGKARVLCNAEMYGPAKTTIEQYFRYRNPHDGLEEPARAILLLCQRAGVE